MKWFSSDKVYKAAMFKVEKSKKPLKEKEELFNQLKQESLNRKAEQEFISEDVRLGRHHSTSSSSKQSSNSKPLTTVNYSLTKSDQNLINSKKRIKSDSISPPKERKRQTIPPPTPSHHNRSSHNALTLHDKGEICHILEIKYPELYRSLSHSIISAKSMIDSEAMDTRDNRNYNDNNNNNNNFDNEDEDEDEDEDEEEDNDNDNDNNNNSDDEYDFDETDYLRLENLRNREIERSTNPPSSSKKSSVKKGILKKSKDSTLIIPMKTRGRKTKK